ncbi:hypothetical protein [Mucilaginibacter sp.]|uniref:hypothetical protein n=1 Tax=Mucilaginibacter sp. TaxID=1882438 RepID=UPI003D0BA6F3
METTDTLDVQPSAEPGIVLTFEAQTYLRESGKWATFLGILGFIFCGLILIGALFAGAIFSKLAAISPNPSAVMLQGMGGFISVFYILLDLVYFFFALYLYQFGIKIKQGIVFADQFHLTAALGKLKSFFKYWGILTIIILSLYALILVVFFGVIAAMHR